MINPSIKSTLNYEQKKEIRNILTRVLPTVFSKHLVDLRFNFWFIKKWYFVLFFGIDRRVQTRQITDRKKSRIIVLLFSLFFYFSTILGAIALIFILLYILKSVAGIDIFPNAHLGDFF